MAKELEVKVLNIDIDLIEEKILSLGGTLISKEHQINTIIDSNKRPIKSFTDAYLRIRETNDMLTKNSSVTLTLKKNISNEGLRENIELNTDIENKEIMLLILKELGFDKITEGYKKRVSYAFENARIDLDIWDEKTYPYPYLEIEVENKEDLHKITKLLGIHESNISTKSIIELRKDVGLE